ncbi:MAG: SUMF1/EgtB/PvdO family nonheme iron enzyme [Deltaproteobacteria bacterium]|nr:SUMF1/EgtB/PvdO family nonheme iron enzyme [Deltaproteobacteria bacterium]
MSGNVWEWVEDKFDFNYDNVPTDGSAFIDTSFSDRVIRGGSFKEKNSDMLKTTRREEHDSSGTYIDVGFRCRR